MSTCHVWYVHANFLFFENIYIYIYIYIYILMLACYRQCCQTKLNFNTPMCTSYRRCWQSTFDTCREMYEAYGWFCHEIFNSGRSTSGSFWWGCSPCPTSTDLFVQLKDRWRKLRIKSVDYSVKKKGDVAWNAWCRQLMCADREQFKHSMANNDQALCTNHDRYSQSTAKVDYAMCIGHNWCVHD